MNRSRAETEDIPGFQPFSLLAQEYLSSSFPEPHYDCTHDASWLIFKQGGNDAKSAGDCSSNATK